MSFDLFIAHAAADLESAQRLYDLLTERFRIFLDAESLAPGDAWDQEIPRAQQASRFSIVLVSRAATEAYYLREEIAAAIQLSRSRQGGHRVLPVYLDGLEADDPRIPYGLRILHGLDAARLGLEQTADEIARRVASDADPRSHPAPAAPAPPARNRIVSNRRRLTLHRRLAALPPVDFERLRDMLSFADRRLEIELPQATRAIDLIHRIRGASDADELEESLAAVERSRPARVARFAGWLLDRSVPWLHRWLVRIDVLAPPDDHRAISDYLKSFHAEMERLNRTGVQVTEVVAARAGSLEPRPMGDGEYASPSVGPTLHKRVRQVLRVLSGLSRGGTHATARVAALSRSKLVRNVERVLARTRRPLILLGDPGSGKSMTLREVGRRFAHRGLDRVRPKVPIYVRLGRWRASEGLRTRSIIALLESSIPAEHRAVREALPVLVAQGRLVVLFDGLDEMERGRYAQRVAALSRFARVHQDRIKTLFACRINDFSPEFEHRQLVLLPFDRGQVREFVRHNVRHPLTVGDSRYSDRRFVAELHRRPVVRDLVSNPLTLFLTCHYITETERWPTSRTELFDLFIDSLIGRLSRHADGCALGSDAREATLEHWAHLAYAISSHGAGTEIERSDAESLAPEMDDAIQLGRRAGLLLVDPDSGAHRFAHHRLQEYLTARYLARSRPRVDWQRLLDAPRWQETLISLAAIDPDSDGIGALADLLAASELAPLQPAAEDTEAETITDESAIESTAEAESLPGEELPDKDVPDEDVPDEDVPDEDVPDGEVPDEEVPKVPASWDAEGERLWADRALLASEVLRESGTTSGAATESLGKALDAALNGLSANGRPTSQVKMLWAWRNVPGLVPFDTLSSQLGSAVLWVRNQAILLVGSLAAAGRIEDRDLGVELAVDLSAGQVLRRVPTYVRSASQSGGIAWLPVFLWACVCQLLFFAAVLAATGDFLLRMVERFPVAALEPPLDAQVAVGGLLLATFLTRRIATDVDLARVTAYTAGLLAILQVFASTVQFEDAFGAAFRDMVFETIVPFLMLMLVVFTIHWSILFLFLAPFAVVWPRRKLVAALRVASQQVIFITDVTMALLAVIVFLFVAALRVFGYLRSTTVGFWTYMAIMGMVMALMLVGFVRSAIRERSIWSPIKETLKAMVAPVVTMAFVAVGIFLFHVEGGVKDWILPIAIGLLGALAVVSVLVALGTRILLRFRGLHLSLGEWSQRIEKAGPIGQSFYLRAIGRHHLGVQPAAFLDALEGLEKAIKAEPAVSQYWRLRHDLEQSLRLERAENDPVTDTDR